MPSRYLRSSRTRSGDTNRLQEQFLRELTRESEKLLRQMSQQFSRDLETQGNQFLQGFLGNGGGGAADGIPNFTGLFSLAGRLFTPKPKTTVTRQESARSREVDERFKLSQTQSLAEAGAMLGQGEKNS